MPTRKQAPEPSLRTILERIDAQSEVLKAQGGRLEHQGAALEAQGAALESQSATLGAHGAAFEDLRLSVDSQNLLLEVMRSQNRTTIEAVETARLALEHRIERLDQETRARDTLFELAIRDLKVNVQQNSVDIRDLAGKVEALSRLEERVSALERRLV